MICPKANFIFIHIPKTAGRSVRSALRPHCYSVGQELSRTLDGLRRAAGMPPSKFPKNKYSALGGHPKADRYLDVMGDDFFAFYRFSFVRNPFDWLVSYYEFCKARPTNKNYELFNASSYSEYIAWACDGNLPTQRAYLVDNDDRICVNYIGRVEAIGIDFEHLCNKLNIENKLPFKNRSRRGSTSQYYTTKSAKMVSERFTEDFNTFGYSRKVERSNEIPSPIEH